ncbi:MAG TPA: hypothetical protein VHV77_16590 [Pirellulales bacterium]|nr:hypothetical protein [Pirellulales bacterium]
MLQLFDRIRIKDEGVRDWFVKALRAKNHIDLQSAKGRIVDLYRQITSLREQEERLLNLRLLDEIDGSTFARKSTEMRDRIAQLRLQIEACDRGRPSMASWPRKCLNFRTASRPSGLAPMYAPNANCSKSCV